MTATTSEPRRLYRSTRDSRVAGVCGGIAEYMGWDPTTVRLAAALSILLPGPQLIAYVIAWVVLPTDVQVFGPVPTSPQNPLPQPPTPPPAPWGPNPPQQ